MAKLTQEERRARLAAREAEREQKRQQRLRRHVVTCPHCGKEVLDHMTRCPFCGGELSPRGYSPMSEEKKKKIRLVTGIIGAIIVIAAFVLAIFLGD